MLANETRCWNPMLLLFALLGAFTVAVATCRFGAGISPDSVTYVTVARSLLAGRGFVDWTGAPFVSQPPLFSLALAGAGWLTGIDPLATARLLNAGLFGAIIYAAGFWLLKNVTARVTALVGCTGVAVSVPLFYVSAMAWSEPLFILLCLLFLMSGEAFLAQPSRRTLSFAAVFAGLGLLTRYTGVTLVLTGILFVLFQSGKELKGRLADAGLFGLLSVSPTVVWIIRNELVSSTAVGDRAPSSMSFQTNLSLTTNTLARWLIHPELNGRAHGLLVVPFVILFLVLLAISTRRHKERPDQDSPRGLGCLVPPVCFAAIYVGTLIVTAARVAFDTIDLRLLSPVYVPLLVAMVCGLDRLVALLKTPNLKRFALAALQTALSIWLIYPVQATTALAADSFRSGWGYASGAWACSPLISYMRQHPPPGHVVSNDPWAVAILTGIPAVPPPEQYYYHSPARNPTSFARFRRQVRSARPLYLVWFEPSPHSFYCHLEEMRSLLQLSLIARFPEGAIYRVESPAAQGPPGRAYLDTLRMEFGATSNSRR